MNKSVKVCQHATECILSHNKNGIKFLMTWSRVVASGDDLDVPRQTVTLQLQNTLRQELCFSSKIWIFILEINIQGEMK